MFSDKLLKIQRCTSLNFQYQLYVWFSRVDSSKDYYQILGVDQNSKVADIKSNFFKLAKKYHPDANPQAGDKFREINEAYQVLSDDSKRNEYDQSRSLYSRSNFQRVNSTKQGAGFSQQYSYPKSATYKEAEDLYRKYTGQGFPQKSQNQSFYYQWQSQNPETNRKNEQGQYYQQYQQTNQYQQQREQERRQEQNRMNQAMKDFIHNMNQSKYPQYNDFTNMYHRDRQQNTQQNPNDYYQFNAYQQQKQNQFNNKQEFQNQQYSPFNESRFQDINDRYEQYIQRMYEEQKKQNFREELRRQKEYEEWDRKKNEIFMKEVNEKIQSFKNNIKDTGKVVEQVASKVESIAKEAKL